MSKKILCLFSASFGLFLMLVGCAGVSSTGISTPKQGTLTPGGGSAHPSACGGTECANATYYKYANFFGGYTLTAGDHCVTVRDAAGSPISTASYFIAVTAGTSRICACGNCSSAPSDKKAFTGPAGKYYFTVCFTVQNAPSSVSLLIE